MTDIFTAPITAESLRALRDRPDAVSIAMSAIAGESARWDRMLYASTLAEARAALRARAPYAAIAHYLRAPDSPHRVAEALSIAKRGTDCESDYARTLINSARWHVNQPDL